MPTCFKMQLVWGVIMEGVKVIFFEAPFDGPRRWVGEEFVVCGARGAGQFVGVNSFFPFVIR